MTCVDCLRERLENPKMGFAYDFTWIELDFTTEKLGLYCTNSICKKLCFLELKLGLCNNLQGWDGEGGGKEGQEGGDICIPVADSC